MCVSLHTDLSVAPSHDWKWFLMISIHNGSLPTKLSCFIWFCLIWEKQSKSKSSLRYRQKWGGVFSKSNSNCCQERTGKCYWLSDLKWQDPKRPGGCAYWQCLLQLWQWDVILKNQVPTLFHQRPWKGARSGCALSSLFFCFSFHFLKALWEQHSFVSIIPYHSLLTSELCFIYVCTHHHGIGNRF